MRTVSPIAGPWFPTHLNQVTTFNFSSFISLSPANIVAYDFGRNHPTSQPTHFLLPYRRDNRSHPPTKADAIAAILDELYPETPIPLRHSDPYTLLIAVLLSAQSTDARVNTITPVLFERASTPKEMVQLSVDEIRDIIRPVGLAPRKSQKRSTIYRISCFKKHGGQVPQSFAELEALPGVGHKTASVVMSQAFGVPAVPVDTHIHRLMYRWGLSNGKTSSKLKRISRRCFRVKAGTSCTCRSSFRPILLPRARSRSARMPDLLQIRHSGTV